MKILQLVLTSAMSFSLIDRSSIIFDGYEKYYPTIPGSIFKKESTVKYTGLKDSTFNWKNHRINIRSAIVFPGEIANDDDLGRNSVLYEMASWACFEGQANSSSGTAVRHFSVYILDARKSKSVKLFKLPGLFGSCLDVRMDKLGRFIFDSAAYDYEKGETIPKGILFVEYAINGVDFSPTGKKAIAEFVERDNVWKFIIKLTP
ncbi:hypothetical protein [Massilia sp. DWR3-1-1]|uniref:hypothetical protein n=1 Tax=Massilia sp. DWR3-1-1 TaxID=2804559 RepID=UPI003CED2E9F